METAWLKYTYYTVGTLNVRSETAKLPATCLNGDIKIVNCLVFGDNKETVCLIERLEAINTI